MAPLTPKAAATTDSLTKAATLTPAVTLAKSIAARAIGCVRAWRAMLPSLK